MITNDNFRGNSTLYFKYNLIKKVKQYIPATKIKLTYYSVIFENLQILF